MEIDQCDLSNTAENITSSSGSSDCHEQHGSPPMTNLQLENCIYRQDVVRNKDGSMIGVVTEVAGDSDSESDITDDDDVENTDDENDSDHKDKGEEKGDEDREGKGLEEAEGEGGNVEKEGGDRVINGSSDDNSSRNDKRGPLIGDQVRVLWMNDSETTHYRSEVMVIDRGFLHGDYVASALDQTGQVGLVVDVNVTVDLLAPDGSTVKDVSSKDLKRVRDITAGDFVISGPWLGRVDDALDNVTVLFDDGSVCKVTRADPLRLRPIAKNFLEDGHCPYHPGQRVRACSSSVFKNARWLSGTWKANRLEGTVIKVAVGSVYVHWVASAGYGPESSISPAEEQNPNRLKLLSCFTHANWQLGDWCLLPSLAFSSCIPLDKGLFRSRLLESNSGLTEFDREEVIPEESNGHVESMVPDGIDAPKTKDEGAQSDVSPKSSSCGSSVSLAKDNVHESWHIHRKKLRKVVVKRDKKLRKKEESFERALLIINTRTTVDVAWQDGTVQQGMNSTSLIPIESPGDHDFVAEQYVVEKAADDSDEASAIRRVGVVKSVNSKEKTACVRWLKQVTRPEDPREFEKEEIVSVYELEGHPDYDYCYGDVVVRLSSIALEKEGACFELGEDILPSNISTNAKQGPSRHSDDKDADVSGEACNEFSDLSWVGSITGLRNGDIQVTWADGMTSTVGPQAVYVVGRDDDMSIVAGSEISADAASWETVEDDEMDSFDNAEKEEPSEGTGICAEAGEDIIDEERNSGAHGPLAIPFACIDFVTKLASGIFSRGHRHGEPFGSDSSGEKEMLLQEEIHISDGNVPSRMSISQDSGAVDTVNGQTNLGKGEEPADVESVKLVDIAETEELLSLSPNGLGGVLHWNDNTCCFKRFDTAKDPVDHFFLEANIPANNGRKWLKKIQRDWNILQNNLPDGIYVRVYEDRMDLLRAVIVGAYGTPYQDGLFFFDFQLPPEYPDIPPSVHYHSGGWKINPNLYEEGKVCLSLLNTWTGRGNEVWDPESSSILQVLVSLQGLVLNSRPYFNEAGYDKQIGTAEGEKNSLSYNENTFLLNCKTMMYLIRKPPKDFEDLVKEHFKRRGYYVLKACDAYMKGYLIGSLAKDALVTDKSEANATSVGFKLMLAKIMPKLISTLTDVGAACQEFKHLQQL